MLLGSALKVTESLHIEQRETSGIKVILKLWKAISYTKICIANADTRRNLHHAI